MEEKELFVWSHKLLGIVVNLGSSGGRALNVWHFSSSVGIVYTIYTSICANNSMAFISVVCSSGTNLIFSGATAS